MYKRQAAADAGRIAHRDYYLALAGHDGAGAGWSARLHGAADKTLADLGETVEPLEGRLADLDRQRLRAAMGAEAFEAAYAAGRTFTPEQFVTLTSEPHE